MNPRYLADAAIHPIHGHYTPAAALAFAIAAFVIAGWWKLMNKVTPWDDHKEIFEKHNDGFLAVRCLQIIALAFAIKPVIGYGGAWWQLALWTLVDCVWVCALLFVAMPLLNWLVKRTHGGIQAIRNNSLPAGLLQGLFYVAYGRIIGGTLPGPGDAIWHTYVVATAFGLLGVAWITLVYWVVVDAVRPFLGATKSIGSDGKITWTLTSTKVSLSDHIQQGNWGATTLAAATTWTLGEVTSSAVSGNFTGWAESIVTFLLAAGFMLLLAFATLWAADKFIITTENLASMVQKRLVRPAVVMATFLVAIGMLASNAVA